MVHLISYDLNGHERPAAYAEVKKAIESYARDFRRPLFSQWLVETSESPKQWSERLQAVIDGDDKLLIVRVHAGAGPGYWGWLPAEIWPWLSAKA